MMPEETTAPGVAQPRRTLGKYQLVERFERGGMATVYKAYDPGLDRYVAIKQIAAHLANDERFVARFRHEAQVLAKLGSEATHVVTIHELVEDEEGGLYIVMEYVEGRTLETYLDAAPISATAAIKLMAQIASGLKAVHQKGIIHRDIKPLNIIITPQGRVKIADFGLAAYAGGSTSVNMGTTKYMAPELLQGGPIDARADLYSLGFTMYELLCPIDRFNELFQDVLTDERSENLRWMSWHADLQRTVPPLAEVNERVPRRLSLIVERLMAKDADGRFYSAEEILSELKAAFGRRRTGTTSVGKELAAEVAVKAAPAAGGPEAARKSTGGDTAPLPRQVDWRKRLIRLGAAAVVLLVGLIVAVQVLRAPIRRARAEAWAQLGQGEAQYEKGAYREAAESYRRFLEFAQPRFPDHQDVPTAQMKLLMAEAYTLREERKWDEADKRIDQADRLGVSRQTIYGFRAEMDALKDYYRLMARAEEAAGKNAYDEALKLLGEAEQKAPERAEVEARRLEVRYRKALYEGETALEQGDWAAARAKYEEAKRLRATPEVEARLEHISANTAFYRALGEGRQAMQAGDFAGAVTHFQEALRLQDDPKVTQLLTDARYQQKFQEGQAFEAREAWTDALAAYQVAQGIKETGEVRTRIDAAQKEIKVADLRAQVETALAAGETDKAIDLLTQVVALKRTLEDEARIVDLRFKRQMELGQAFEREAKWDEAEAAYTEALRIKNVPEADRAIREVQQRRKYANLLALGDTHFKSGLLEQALQVFRDAQKVQPGQEIDRRIADCQYELFMRAGREQEKLENFSGAYAFYRQAVALKATAEAQEAVERVKAKMPP